MRQQQGSFTKGMSCNTAGPCSVMEADASVRQCIPVKVALHACHCLEERDMLVQPRKSITKRVV